MLAFPRRIFGSFVLRNEMMPAQSETSSVGGASVDSEPLVARRPQAKPVATQPNAPKAGQVRLSVQPLRRPFPARCAVYPAAFISVSRVQ